MGKITKIKGPNGEPIDAEQVEISQSSEHWNQYLLEDGTVFKLKTIAARALRVIGQYDPEGNPVYIMQSSNVVAVDCPEALKKGV
jgi:hypothetical protein